jgi:hypothetical protein
MPVANNKWVTTMSSPTTKSAYIYFVRYSEIDGKYPVIDVTKEQSVFNLGKHYSVYTKLKF